MPLRQRASGYGLQTEVPADWPFNAWSGCGSPPPAQVVRGAGLVAGCGSDQGPAAQLSLTRLAPNEDIGPQHPGPTAPQVVHRRLDGHPVTVSTGRAPDGRATLYLTVEDTGSVLDGVSPDAAVLDHVLAATHVVQVDATGCATTLGPDPAWDRSGPGPAVDLRRVGTPTTIGVCGYEAAHGVATGEVVLAGSTELTGAAAGAVADALSAGGAGPSPDDPAGCAPGPERDPLWLLVRYAHAAAVPVHVRYDTCLDRRVTAPGGVSPVTQTLLGLLNGALHRGYGWSGPIAP